MKVFYITLISTFILALIARICTYKNKKPNLLLSILVMIIIIGVAGLRSNIGDTYMYKVLYDNVIAGTVVDGAYEPGFIAFLQLLTNISIDPQIMIFATSLVTQGLNIWTLRTYASLFELQIYMYITSGYFLTLMNGIRQGFAAAIMFASTKLIINNNFKLYLLITLAASTFHSSALIMIPVYFIVKNEAWSKNMIRIIAIASICFLIGQPVIDFMFSLLEGTRYGGYSEFDEGGVNILRVIIAAVPVVFAYLGRKKLKEEWPESDVFVNMSIINLIIMAFSLFNWIFARFNYYFQPYTFILLPYTIKVLFNKRQKGLIYYLFLVCYFIYMYFEYVISLGIQYKSNFIVF